MAVAINDEYDLIVIGAGSAGLVAASFAGRIGLKVALIEREGVLGGDCTWVGCVPSKALLKVAKQAHAARTGAEFGIAAAVSNVDMSKVSAYVKGVQDEVYQHETPAVIEERGVEVLLGLAKFTDPHTVLVDMNDGSERTLRGKKFVIATGARPGKLPIPGLDEVPYFTYRNLFDNDKLPKRMVTIGAGPIGMEMSQAYSRFGAEVTIISDRIMANDEPEVGETMRSVFEAEGIKFVLDFVAEVKKDGEEIVITTKNGTEIRTDMLLVAAGRVPNVDTMDLEKAGVEYTKGGVKVDENLQTTQEHIFAAGDVAGGPQFTHFAGFQGSIAARNALFPGKSNGTNPVLPWATFTEPEAAHVGMTEAEARSKYGDQVKVSRFNLDEGDRALAEHDTAGFIKLVYRGNGKILGATIVANRAGEMINEYTLAIQNGWTASNIAAAIHVYPTYGQILANHANKVRVQELMNGVSGAVFNVAKKVLF